MQIGMAWSLPFFNFLWWNSQVISALCRYTTLRALTQRDTPIVPLCSVRCTGESVNNWFIHFSSNETHMNVKPIRRKQKSISLDIFADHNTTARALDDRDSWRSPGGDATMQCSQWLNCRLGRYLPFVSIELLLLLKTLRKSATHFCTHSRKYDFPVIHHHQAVAAQQRHRRVVARWNRKCKKHTATALSCGLCVGMTTVRRQTGPLLGELECFVLCTKELFEGNKFRSEKECDLTVGKTREQHTN